MSALTDTEGLSMCARAYLRKGRYTPLKYFIHELAIGWLPTNHFLRKFVDPLPLALQLCYMLFLLPS